MCKELLENTVAETEEERAARKAAKKAAKAVAAAVEAEPEVDEEAARLARKAAKKAAKAAAAAAEAEPVPEPEVDEEAARLARKAAKKAAKLAAQETEVAAEAVDQTTTSNKRKAVSEPAAADEVEEPAGTDAKQRKCEDESAVATEPVAGQDLTVFVAGIPWSADEATVRNDFAECGEITRFNMLMNDEGKPKGICFVTYAESSGVDAALKFDGTDYGGRTLKVEIASQGGKGKGKDGKGKGKDGKGKGKDGKGKADRDPALEVFVGSLPYECTEEALKEEFGKCGEFSSLRMPLNDEGSCRGICFINFKTMDGVEAALKLHDQEFMGKWLNVKKAGEGKGDGKGKGKDGKDGKGKGKGKDKGKKGKKGGLSAEANAAKNGAMVESTGTKQTFNDSDSE